MKFKDINIPYTVDIMEEKDGKKEVKQVEKIYGPVVLKRMKFKEKCDFKGKVLKIDVRVVNGQTKEVQSIDTGALFFWTVVYSIKSLPKYPDFENLTEEKKADIVSYFGCSEDEPSNLGEVLFQEAREINPIVDQSELKKK